MDRQEFHLNTLQDIVSRLSSNSFVIKGWSITVASAFFALAAGIKAPQFACFGMFPIVMFWVLDGYYLTLERRYRSIFVGSFKAIDSDDTNMIFDHRAEKDDFKILSGVFSLPLLLFYGSLIFTLLALAAGMVFSSPAST